MIKIALVCLIIAIGYIHCNLTNISNNIDLPASSPSTNAEQIDMKENEQMKFLALVNLSDIRTIQSDKKPSDMSGYYKWLDFLKTSTSTQTNNVTIPSEIIL